MDCLRFGLERFGFDPKSFSSPDGEWKTLFEETIDMRRMLCGLRAKVLEAAQPESKSRMNGQRNDGARKTRH